MATKSISALIFQAFCATIVLPTLSCQLSEEATVCDDTAVAAPAGEITQGEAPLTVKVSAPYTVRGVLRSKRAIDLLTIGGVPASNAAAGTNFSSWTVTLQAPDLEANRTEGTSEAKLDVVAYDVCGDATDIASTSLNIGPSTGVPVKNLTLEVQIPKDECYLPASKGASALVRVAADREFAGASVTLFASAGTLSATTVQLLDDGVQASSFVTFTTETPGIATLSAVGQGAPAEPVEILVAGAPTVSPTQEAAIRGISSSVYVTSHGNLDTCMVERTYPSNTKVTLVKPKLGVVTSSKSVNSKDHDCTTAETLRFQVLFDVNTPDGATVTIRCDDTFLQEGEATVTVAVKPQ